MPKNPYSYNSLVEFKISQGTWNAWENFEAFAVENTYPTDESLVPGDYPAEIFGYVVWQVSNLTETLWRDADKRDYELYNDYKEYSTRRIKIGLKTRQYLPLKPVPPEGRPGSGIPLEIPPEKKQEFGEWINQFNQ